MKLLLLSLLILSIGIPGIINVDAVAYHHCFDSDGNRVDCPLPPPEIDKKSNTFEYPECTRFGHDIGFCDYP